MVYIPIDYRGAKEIIAEVSSKRKENDKSPKTKDRGQKINGEDSSKLVKKALVSLGK